MVGGSGRYEKGRFDTLVTGTSVPFSSAVALPYSEIEQFSGEGCSTNVPRLNRVWGVLFCLRFFSVGPRSRRPQPGQASKKDLEGESTRPFSELKRLSIGQPCSTDFKTGGRLVTCALTTGYCWRKDI
jgi:hypothetical protein